MGHIVYGRNPYKRKDGEVHVERRPTAAAAGAHPAGAFRHEPGALPDGGGNPPAGRASGTSPWSGVGELLFPAGRRPAGTGRSFGHRGGMRKNAGGLLLSFDLRGGRRAAARSDHPAGRLPGGPVRAGCGGARPDRADRRSDFFLHPDRPGDSRHGKKSSAVASGGRPTSFNHDPFSARLRKNHAFAGPGPYAFCGRGELSPAGLHRR